MLYIVIPELADQDQDQEVEDEEYIQTQGKIIVHLLQVYTGFVAAWIPEPIYMESRNKILGTPEKRYLDSRDNILGFQR
jgi:hypothetical protein